MGIGTSEVEHVPRPRRCRYARSRPWPSPSTVSCRRRHQQRPHPGGHRQDRYRWRAGLRPGIPGPAIEKLSMDARMTMQHVHRGRRARRDDRPDEITYEFLKGRPHADRSRVGRGGAVLGQPAHRSDAEFDAEVHINASELTLRHMGHQPGPGRAARISRARSRGLRQRQRQAGRTAGAGVHGPDPGTPLREVPVDAVFVGSCTNGRIEDLRAVADVLRGRHVADGVRMLIVPGSMKVRAGRG